MNKKILLFVFVFVLGLMSVNAGNFTISEYGYNNSLLNNYSANVVISRPLYDCYQESTNNVNQTGIDGNCGLNYSGSFTRLSGSSTNLNNANDGDYLTYYQSAAIGITLINITYITPSSFDSNVSSMWRLKLVTSPSINSNFSIPSSCLKNNLSILLYFNPSSKLLNLSCYDGSVYNSFYYTTLASNSILFSDEAMYWVTNYYNKTFNDITGVIYTDLFNNDTYLYNVSVFKNNYLLNQVFDYNVSTDYVFNRTVVSTLPVPSNGYFGETSVITLNVSKVYGQSYNNANLVYNGVTYNTAIQTDYTNYTLFTQTITNNALGNFSYYWNVNLVDYGTTFNFNTSNGSHFVGSLTVNLTFYDTSTNNVMNAKNVSFKIIGDIQNNYSTTTGNYNLTNLSMGTYTIISNSQGYLQNSYVFSISSSTNNPNINIYLTPNSTQTYYIVFTIIEKLSRQPIQGAIVTIQHYINNAWVTEQIYTTDMNGRGQGYFIINTDYYNFVITYNGVVYSGALNNDANKKIMFYQDYLDGLGIEISLSQTNYINTLQGISSAQTGLRYQSVTNNSGNFIYNFLDTLGQNRNWTLMVYQGNNLNCSTSAYTSSGNLACLISNNGSEQWFQAYTFIDGIPDKATSQRIGVNEAWDFEWGIGGWIFTIFIVIIAFTSFAQVPSISIMIGSAFFALALFFNIIFTRSANVSQLGIVIVFIAFLLAKIPSNSGVNS